MKQKAFTLIELLVVVAIIGILAAVGVVAYNGYTVAAKEKAARSNHAAVVKYISAEVTKCELGETSVMDGELLCSNANIGIKIAEAALRNANTSKTLSNIKNPYDTKVLALRKQSGHSTGADADVGYINVGGHNTIPLVQVNGCVALKCDPTPNRIWANLCFQASC